MTEFRPTRPPAGRLVRLGVVLDTRNDLARVRELATMCDRAGIDAVWIHDRVPGGAGPRVEALDALTLSRMVTARVRLGVVVDPAARSPETLASALTTIDVASGGRVEVGLADEAPGDIPAGSPEIVQRLEAYAARVRALLAGPATPRCLPVQAGPPRLGIEARSPEVVPVALRRADDVLLTPRPIDELVVAARRIVQACEESGRPPWSLGIAATLPVSIGRTTAEAQARADGESSFEVVGHPARVGIFGRLEECQDRVIALAHAGITDLRCVIPNSPDVHDVIAQLTSMVVGTTAVLRPEAPRSPSPGRPREWGAPEPPDAPAS